MEHDLAKAELVRFRSMPRCTCGHRFLSHRYISIIGDNSGDCLCKCDCTRYEKGEQ